MDWLGLNIVWWWTNPSEESVCITVWGNLLVKWSVIVPVPQQCSPVIRVSWEYCIIHYIYVNVSPQALDWATYYVFATTVMLSCFVNSLHVVLSKKKRFRWSTIVPNRCMYFWNAIISSKGSIHLEILLQDGQIVGPRGSVYIEVYAHRGAQLFQSRCIYSDIALNGGSKDNIFRFHFEAIAIANAVYHSYPPKCASICCTLGSTMSQLLQRRRGEKWVCFSPFVYTHPSERCLRSYYHLTPKWFVATLSI